MGEGVAGFFKFSWTIAAFFQECVSNRNGPKHYTRMIIIENKRTQSEEKLVRWRSKTESRLVESCFTSFDLRLRPRTSTKKQKDWVTRNRDCKKWFLTSASTNHTTQNATCNLKAVYVLYRQPINRIGSCPAIRSIISICSALGASLVRFILLSPPIHQSVPF